MFQSLGKQRKEDYKIKAGIQPAIIFYLFIYLFFAVVLEFLLL